MVASFLLIGCLLAAPPETGTADLKNDGLQKEVARLVKRLNADTQADRAAAKALLLQRGPAILGFLPPPESVKSEEQGKAILDIRQQLQKQQAEESVATSTITLHAKGVKLSKLLADIQKQSGNTIADLPRQAAEPIPDPEITINLDKKPFWPALDEVLDRGQVSVYPYGQPDALQVVPRGPNDLPRLSRAAMSGPLRIDPVRVTAKRELRSSAPAALQVVLEVAWEPRLHPIALKQRMADVKAFAASGAALALDDTEAEKEAFPRRGTSAVEMEVALAMPPQSIKEIASLSGSLRVMLLGRVETFKFTGLLKGKQEQRIAGARVAIDEFRKNGATWEAFVRLKFDDAGDSLESHRSWVLQNEAFLEDEAGKPVPFDSMETTLRTKDEIGVGYVFALPEGQSPEKMAFVYKSPGMVFTKDFKYEVKGIKLP